MTLAMRGYLVLLLHAHLPFVRHPEHGRFLEESWLYEAILETYLPLLEVLEQWQAENLPAKLALSLSPTLCSMLRDPLLQARFARRLDDLIRLAESELDRTRLDAPLFALARHYQRRFARLRRRWDRASGDLVRAFGRLQEQGRVEIFTCAATHAVLPLLSHHAPSVRAQVGVARDAYRECFECDPRGFWLPECAYTESVEPVLKEAGVRSLVLEHHGILHATPQPRFGVHAPVLTPHGLAAFGRDPDSARQVWSRTEGYPGDPRYREFYRDIGYDLDFEHVRACLPSPGTRGFTGIKYHRVTGPTESKAIYDRESALAAAGRHAEQFLDARMCQAEERASRLGRPPVFLMPYDAELFGHWWYEGIEFLDCLVRAACRESRRIGLTTPGDYLAVHPTHQVAAPAASSWGEHGYYQVWIHETNDWILPHLDHAQERMTEMARRFRQPDARQTRALQQAARELMLAQASDWPFILRTGTSPDYARGRVTEHLFRFNRLHEQLISGRVDESQFATWEAQDNLFPNLDFRYFR